MVHDFLKIQVDAEVSPSAFVIIEAELNEAVENSILVKSHLRWSHIGDARFKAAWTDHSLHILSIMYNTLRHLTQ